MKKTPSKAVETAAMDREEIRRLIELGDTKGLAEFEVEKAGVRVRIKYNRETAVIQYAPPVPAAPAAPRTATPEMNSSAAVAAAPAPRVEDKNIFLVKSPIVGTFYAASDPQSPPFVKVGDRVKTGQVLCIVEAMKLMNEIESEVAGEVVKVLAQNSQPVEYGEALFEIRTS